MIASTRSGSRSSERGTAVIGSAAGVAAFLLFLVSAVQLTVNMAATSSFTAAGYDSARAVASRLVDHTDPAAVARAQRSAEDRFRSVSGSSADEAKFIWQVDTDTVRLRVVVDAPTVLPRVLGGYVGLDHLDRTFVVRIEQVR